MYHFCDNVLSSFREERNILILYKEERIIIVTVSLMIFMKLFLLTNLLGEGQSD